MIKSLVSVCVPQESNASNHILAYSLLHLNGRQRTPSEENPHARSVCAQICAKVESQLNQLELPDESEYEFQKGQPERDSSILLWLEASVVAQCTAQVSNVGYSF